MKPNGRNLRAALSAPFSLAVALALALTLVTALSARSSSRTQLADSMQKKIDFVQQNAKATQPDPRPTVFSEQEINAYFAERRIPKMPQGIQSVVFNLAPNLVTANVRVDFDQLGEQVRKDHPLLYIFSGTHDAVVVAETQSSGGGTAHVKVRSLEIDGMNVPRRAMELFIERFVNPKYPMVKLEGDYHLPSRIDSAVITTGTGTVIQK